MLTQYTDAMKRSATGLKAEYYTRILTQAHAAASAAMANSIEDWACGFAWVTVSGNDPIARACRAELKRLNERPEGISKRRMFGAPGYPKGWQWWGPGDYHGQSINVKEAGARAFRDKLAEYGIVATTGSRLD